MARVTSDIAVEKIGNKFDMILIAAARAREISYKKIRIADRNKVLVTAIREIEEGKIGREYLLKVR
jgi:DNA-directed RNA polymerase subunit omega